MQSISVSDAAVMLHLIPSITIVLSVNTVEKPLPVNLTVVLPTTVPNRGVIESSLGVKVFAKLTLFVTFVSCPCVIT
jgi:hypothetical protein